MRTREGADGATTASVVVCAYTEQRWDLLERAVVSLQRQTHPPDEVLLVVDHHEALLRAAQGAFPGVTVVPNLGVRGLSGARNTGVAKSSGDVVAFLDDDARAAPDWLERLVRHYADPQVLGVGGLVRADWAGGRPAWFPEEYEWVVGCSYRGQPTALAEVRNPIGAGMSFRRTVFEEVGGFDTGVGRVGSLPVGCEETELAIRARRRWPGGRVLHDPSAVVDHVVPASRATVRYLLTRCWSEGISKAAVAHLAGAGAALASERGYTTRTLPLGVLRELSQVRGRRDAARLGRVAAMGTGLAAAAAGYARASVPRRPVRTPPRRDRMTLVENTPDAAATPPEPTSASSTWSHFDLHGRVAVRVADDAPTAPQLRDMFRAFRTQEPSTAALALEVSAPFEDIPDAADLETTLTYTEDSVTIPSARMQVVRSASGYRLHGPGELLTSALPLVDALMVRSGAAMFHAATIDYRGQGIALPAAGGTGKTSTIAKFMRLDGVGFMGDDWAFLSEEGEMLGFAKPMFIKPHHRPIYPHLFDGPHKPLVPVRLSRPVGHLTTIVHPVVARYPRAAAFARRWSPEHRMVTPERALNGRAVSTRAPLALAVYLERYAGSATRVLERSRAWMASRMVGNFHIEMPGHSQTLVTALGATGPLALDEYFSRKAAVIRSALEGVPTYLMQVPAAMSPDEASDSIVAHIRQVLGEEGR